MVRDDHGVDLDLDSGDPLCRYARKFSAHEDIDGYIIQSIIVVYEYNHDNTSNNTSKIGKITTQTDNKINCLILT
jgi:hypothetical protein